MFWHPESVMEVGLAEFDASALYRSTRQSPACTMPLGSGVTPMVPVLESHDATVALKYGVALSGLPMIEMIRPAAVNLMLGFQPDLADVWRRQGPRRAHQRPAEGDRSRRVSAIRTRCQRSGGLRADQIVLGSHEQHVGNEARDRRPGNVLQCERATRRRA